MKNTIPKLAIPESKILMVRKLIAPHFDPTFHFHPEYQLFLVLEGKGTRFIGDTMKPFQKGDLVLTGPNLPHLWRNDNVYFDKKNKLSTAGIVIYFHDYFLGDPIHEKEELESIQRLLQKSVRGLEITGKANRAICKMMVELLELKGIGSVIQLLKILDIISNSSECHQITHNHYVSLNNQTETDRLNKVYEYVMKNFGRKISLKEVSAITCMTPSSFSRYFKSRVNKSFSDFLKEIRIDHACKLLNEERITISDVAYTCGFQTLSNFNRQFKQVRRESPLRYKKEYLKTKIDAFRDFSVT